jgi:hypothetical protein
VTVYECAWSISVSFSHTLAPVVASRAIRRHIVGGYKYFSLVNGDAAINQIAITFVAFSRSTPGSKVQIFLPLRASIACTAP